MNHFYTVKITTEEILNSIIYRYNEINKPSAFITEKIKILKTLVGGFNKKSSLNYYLNLKILIQEIEIIFIKEEIFSSEVTLSNNIPSKLSNFVGSKMNLPAVENVNSLKELFTPSGWDYIFKFLGHNMMELRNSLEQYPMSLSILEEFFLEKYILEIIFSEFITTPINQRLLTNKIEFFLNFLMVKSVDDHLVPIKNRLGTVDRSSYVKDLLNMVKFYIKPNNLKNSDQYKNLNKILEDIIKDEEFYYFLREHDYKINSLSLDRNKKSYKK